MSEPKTPETVAEYVGLYGEALVMSWLRTEEVRYHRRRTPRKGRAKGPTKAALNGLLAQLTPEEIDRLSAVVQASTIQDTAMTKTPMINPEEDKL